MSSKIKSWFRKVFSHAVLIEAPANRFAEPQGERELMSSEDKGKVKLGIIVGHSAKAMGAKMIEPFGKYEYEYNKIIAGKIRDYASSANLGVEVELIYRDGRGIEGAYALARQLLCDCVIELHFNAGGGTGTETLSTADASDVTFAQLIHKKVCEVFGREGSSRGVKSISKSADGGANLHQFPGGVNCLVEPFFGDVEAEASLGMNRADEYAEALVQAVWLWGKQVDLLR
jgi:N-acetylmuramoyl-L-alanine amidase